MRRHGQSDGKFNQRISYQDLPPFWHLLLDNITDIDIKRSHYSLQLLLLLLVFLV